MTDIKQYEPLWGSWYVDSLIGEGSFGKVYKVHKEEFGSTYYSAVKIITIPQNESDLRQILREGMDDASVRSYFSAFVSDIIQEIDLMSKFRGNSNIVSFEDHKVIEQRDTIGWDILIRMELLTSLSDYAANNIMKPDDIIRLGIEICRALERCAMISTIHRDIKPDNIFVSEYGDFKLGDFGIARQIERTMSGLSKKGTYTYMAPEVFKGDDYGASVDIYSLGIVMYRYLNQNRAPFLPDFPTPITPRDRDESLQRRMSGEAIPLINGIDPSLNAIVRKACAFDRKSRFANATEMREALEMVMSGFADIPNGAYSYRASDLNDKQKGTTYRESTSTTEGVFTERPNRVANESTIQAEQVKPNRRYLKKAAITVIALMFIFAIVTRIFFVSIITLDGSSMQPTILNNDKVAVIHPYNNPKDGDIVVFKTETYGATPLTKRVIASGGERIDINFTTHEVTVNGKVIKEPYISEPTSVSLDFDGPVKVPQGYIFVMGDNRNNSTDSRSSLIGLVDVRDVLGKAQFIIVPGPNAYGLRQWNRLGFIR